MSLKLNKNYVIYGLLIVVVLIIFGALGLALGNSIKMQRESTKQIEVQKSLFDKAKIIDEVCVKNNHIIIFSVIKAESNEPKPIEHAVVIGYCTDGEK